MTTKASLERLSLAKELFTCEQIDVELSQRYKANRCDICGQCQVLASLRESKELPVTGAWCAANRLSIIHEQGVES